MRATAAMAGMRWRSKRLSASGSVALIGGHAEGGAGRGAESLGVPGTGGAGQQQNTSCGEGLGGAEERADVAGVLQAGENENQGGGGSGR